MLGRQDRWQGELFVAGSLQDLVPDDHILRLVDQVLDLAWLRDEVSESYCLDNGRPGIDPEAAVRLMLGGFFQNIVHDRKLMREAQVNVAIRWFAGYRLHEKLPDHSSLTRLRQRWGAERFKRIFQRIVQTCVEAGLVSGDTIHIDSTLIRADVSWDSLVEQHTDLVWDVNVTNQEDAPPSGEPPQEQARPQRTQSRKPKRASTTDPEASLATASRKQRAEPSYKQHTAVDDKCGVIVNVETSTGETNDGDLVAKQVAQVSENTRLRIHTLTADSGYAYGKVYGQLEKAAIDPVIPPKKEVQPGPRFSIRRFKYDGKHKTVTCPRGRKLQRSTKTKHGWFYRSRCYDCADCPMRSQCLSPAVDRRTIVISDDYEALLRARRRRSRWPTAVHAVYQRHRWRAEGAHAEAKNQHGLKRATRRGLDNVAIQVYLTACVMNLKRLAAVLGGNTGLLHSNGVLRCLPALIRRSAVRFQKGNRDCCRNYAQAA